jgi:hypothetical protein
MGIFPTGFKKVALRLILVAAPVGCVYLYLVEIGLMWTPSTCMTETIQEIADPSGYDFKVTRLDARQLQRRDSSASTSRVLTETNRYSCSNTILRGLCRILRLPFLTKGT